MAEYTKGEWKLRLVLDESGDVYIVEADRLCLAKVYNEANAPLIAAAPEYHRFVKSLINYYDCMGKPTPGAFEEIITQARELQAKAEGK